MLDEATDQGDVYRHPVHVRLAHWLNALCIAAMLPTGIEILAHHPELYWGETGFFGDRAFLSFGTTEQEIIGIGLARSIHFLAAWIFLLNGVVYFAAGMAGRHTIRRLLPSRTQLSRRAIVQTLKDHVALRHHADIAEYNLVQKLAYLFVLTVLGPMMIMTGLAMSPAISASFPWLITVFNGRQTARTLHFLAACGLVGFVVVHVWQVWLIGWRSAVRAMITGWHEPSKRSSR